MSCVGGERLAVSEALSHQAVFSKQQADSQHRVPGANLFTFHLTAFHTTSIWTNPEAMAPSPASVPRERHTHCPLSPALMPTQRQTPEGWTPKARTPTVREPCLAQTYADCEDSSSSIKAWHARPHAVITQTEYVTPV